MSDRPKSPDRAPVDDLADSVSAAVPLEYAEEIDQFHRTLRRALQAVIDDDIVEFDSRSELHERLAFATGEFRETLAQLHPSSGNAPDFWSQVEAAFHRRLPTSDLQGIRRHVSEVWGPQSSAETFLDNLLSFVATHGEVELSLARLRSAIQGVDSDAEKDRLAIWFSTGKQMILKARFRLRRDGRDDQELSPSELNRALHEGELLDPESHEPVQQFPEHVFPYFVVLGRLRRLAERHAA